MLTASDFPVSWVDAPLGIVPAFARLITENIATSVAEFIRRYCAGAGQRTMFSGYSVSVLACCPCLLLSCLFINTWMDFYSVGN